ncbi:MAG TPA: isoprenyl transferase [Armatimonadota bacterium]|nr:isoprenyl transferase [Armatimonadota bacterium]
MPHLQSTNVRRDPPPVEIDTSRLPGHIAIIMDGNGRWARRRGLPRIAGHRQGALAVRRVVEACGELGIPALTLYTFSAENWRRPKDEVDSLMFLIENVIRREIRELNDRGARIRIIGRPQDLPESLREELRRDIELTSHNDKLLLNLAINYGGRTEILDAARALAEQARSGTLAPEDITEELFRKQLYAPDLPDPDLLIRTGGDMRVSNFLLWQIAYSEIWVTETYWPDFGRDEILQAIAAFQERERRYGALANR